MDSLTKVSKNLSKTFLNRMVHSAQWVISRGVLNHVNNLEPMYVQPPPSVLSNIGERVSKGNVDEPFGSLPDSSPYYAYVSRQGRVTDH